MALGLFTGTSVGNNSHSFLLSSPNPPKVHLLALCCPALRSGYEAEEADLPKLEDLQGAAKGLMRLQDVYALQVASLARGRFQRVSDGKSIEIYLPTVSVPLSGDDCFLVGKVHKPLFAFVTSELNKKNLNHGWEKYHQNNRFLK